MTTKQRRWRTSILRLITKCPRHKLFTSDALRVMAMTYKLGNPNRSSAWGNLLLTAHKHGLIEKTGRYLSSAIPSNHKRPVAEWRRVVPRPKTRQEDEWVTIRESPTKQKRVKLDKSTNDLAGCESTKGQERAKEGESTKVKERAKEGESTKVKEQAK